MAQDDIVFYICVIDSTLSFGAGATYTLKEALYSKDFPNVEVKEFKHVENYKHILEQKPYIIPLIVIADHDAKQPCIEDGVFVRTKQIVPRATCIAYTATPKPEIEPWVRFLKIGTIDSNITGTLSKKVHDLEIKYLSPKSQFRAFPFKGAPPLTVSFQNFCSSHVIRYLWDFGDGTTSIERTPSQTYPTEGIYTVKLNVITSTGGQGVATKTNYITVDEDEMPTFFYVVQQDTTLPAYSTETAVSLGSTAATFDFVDQTDGDILQRYWVFGDGEFESVDDPNTHSTTHVYAEPGEYEPSLLVVFSDENLKRSFLQDSVVVI